MSQEQENSVISNYESNQGEGEGEDSTVQRDCIMCSEVPESIICLSCSHCLCLICSAKILFSINENLNEPISMEELRCPACGQVTQLSEEIQDAFQELFQSGELDVEGAPMDEMENGNEDQEDDQEEEVEMQEENNQEEPEQDEEEPEEEEEEEDQEGENMESQNEEKNMEEDYYEEDIENNDQLKDSEQNFAMNNSPNMQYLEQNNNKKIPLKNLPPKHNAMKKEKEENLIREQVVDDDRDDEEDYNEELMDQMEEQNQYQDQYQEQHMVEASHISQKSDISLHFTCDMHPNEDYSFYSASLQRLLCAQCLLEMANNGQQSDAKSIKKSLSQILQHFEDFLNSVELNKNLIKNRHNEVNIKTDSLRIKIQSLKNKFGLKFEELIDSLNDIKNKFQDTFEDSLKDILVYNETISKELEDRIEKFEGILEQIGSIQQTSDNANEDLLEFFFINHKEFNEKLIKDKSMKTKVDNCLTMSDDFMNKIDEKLTPELDLTIERLLRQSEELLYDTIKFDVPRFENNQLVLGTDKTESYFDQDYREHSNIKTTKSQRSESNMNVNNIQKRMKPPKQPMGQLYSKNETKNSAKEDQEGDYKGPTQSAQDRVNQLKNRLLALDNTNNPPPQKKNSHLMSIKQNLESMDNRNLGGLNVSQEHKDGSYNNGMQGEPSISNSLNMNPKSANKPIPNQYSYQNLGQQTLNAERNNVTPSLDFDQKLESNNRGLFQTLSKEEKINKYKLQQGSDFQMSDPYVNNNNVLEQSYKKDKKFIGDTSLFSKTKANNSYDRPVSSHQMKTGETQNSKYLKSWEDRISNQAPINNDLGGSYRYSEHNYNNIINYQSQPASSSINNKYAENSTSGYNNPMNANCNFNFNFNLEPYTSSNSTSLLKQHNNLSSSTPYKNRVPSTATNYSTLNNGANNNNYNTIGGNKYDPSLQQLSVINDLRAFRQQVRERISHTKRTTNTKSRNISLLSANK